MGGGLDMLPPFLSHWTGRPTFGRRHLQTILRRTRPLVNRRNSACILNRTSRSPTYNSSPAGSCRRGLNPWPTVPLNGEGPGARKIDSAQNAGRRLEEYCFSASDCRTGENYDF